MKKRGSEGPRSFLQYLRGGGEDDILDLLVKAGRVVDVGKLFGCVHGWWLERVRLAVYKHEKAGTKSQRLRRAAHRGRTLTTKKSTYIRRDTKERLVQVNDVDELGQGRRRQVKSQETGAPRGHARLRCRRYQLAPTSKWLVLRHRHLSQVAIPAFAVSRVGKWQPFVSKTKTRRGRGGGNRSSSRQRDLLHCLDGDILELLKDDRQCSRGCICCRLVGLVVEQNLGLAVAEQEGHKDKAAALVPHAWEGEGAVVRGRVEKGDAAQAGLAGSWKREQGMSWL